MLALIIQIWSPKPLSIYWLQLPVQIDNHTHYRGWFATIWQCLSMFGHAQIEWKLTRANMQFCGVNDN